ncbi:MAG TPA: DUF4870 domain-containing protein [Terracidiphilus sp.]|nr:DUF4870 domain-containing protein [Terracidiphilus sp.]
MSDPGSSSPGASGLSDNAAAGLSYIAVIPAIIFLFLEPYNRKPYIRFHAWQCIILAAAWVVIDIVLGLLALFGTLFQLIDLGLYSLVALAMLILWLMALIKALNGERYKLPIVGDIAERLAER